MFKTKPIPEVSGVAIYQTLFDASLYFEVPMPRQLTPRSIQLFANQVSDYICDHINDIYWSEAACEIHKSLLALQTQLFQTGWRQSLGWAYPPSWHLLASIRCADRYRQLIIRVVSTIPVSA